MAENKNVRRIEKNTPAELSAALKTKMIGLERTNNDLMFKDSSGVDHLYTERNGDAEFATLALSGIPGSGSALMIDPSGNVIRASTSLLGATTWLTPVIGFYDPSAALPLGAVNGDRYVASETGTGWTRNYVYEYVNGDWVETVIDTTGTYSYFSSELKLYLYSSGSWAEAPGGSITEDITSTTTVGALEAGSLVEEGTTLTDFAKALLLKTYYPTFTAPTAPLSASPSGSIELGTISNVVLSVAFNRGQILGDNVGGVWNPSTVQNPRAGVANNYTIAGTSTGLTPNRTINSYQFVEGANTWSATTSYDEGPQPLDSLGDDYNTPLAAGSLTTSTTVQGRRAAMYGSDSVSAVPYTTSTQVRGLAGSLLNPANGSAFTINIPIGAKMVVFAYPATLRAVLTVKYVEGFNAEVKSIFNETTVAVAGANTFSPVNYRVYTYVPAEPFSATATYNVTI